MANKTLFNTSGSIALMGDYTVRGPSREYFLSKQAAQTLRIWAEFFVVVEPAVLIVDEDTDLGVADLDSGAAFDASATYYIYACIPLVGSVPVFMLSKNSTYPTGWTAATSRQIGGFQTDGSGNIDASSVWDLRTVDITVTGVTDAMIPADEISAAKVKFSQYFQRGSGVFAGSSGVTVAITDVGTTDYQVSIMPEAQSDYIGTISVAKAANAFVVKNSGSDQSTAFGWTLSVGY